jgi:hypothetical protein
MRDSQDLMKVMYPFRPVGMVVSFAIVIVNVVIALLKSIKQISAV